MIRSKSFDDAAPLLYLIATPIGNLLEISKRALEVIESMDLIAAEDTRNAKSLLSQYSIKKECFSLREHNESEASDYLISLLLQGKKIAYMSDAGYPGISDPGTILVKKAISQGIKVSTISGSSAFLNSLVSSGLPTNHFYFYGFLSPKEKEAETELANLKNIPDTLIFYESPHRIFKTLHVLEKVLGNRAIVLARELTKINEEYIRGTISEIASIDPSTIKGEIVLLVSGRTEEQSIDDSVLINRVGYLTNKGISHKDAIEITSDEYKVSKNYIYNLVHKS